MKPEPSHSELRQLLEETLEPKRLLVRRAPGGGFDLRILSDCFAHSDDPLTLLDRALLGPLAPSRLYGGRNGALRRLIQSAVAVTEAQVVLLDARSGYCDESAMAVLDLADEIVLFASPSPSTYASFAPAIEALERNRRARGRPQVLHVAAGMLPAGEQARASILAELQDELEAARAQIAEMLRTPPDELPSDLPQSILQVHPDWAAKVLREAQIPVSQAESEPDPDQLGRLFTRTPDLERFLRHDTFLVRGPKGSGKSYLRRICLEQPQRLGSRHGLDQTLFVEGYASPRAGRAANPPINRDLLNQLAKRRPDQWPLNWSALSLARAIAKLNTQGLPWTPQSLSPQQRQALEQLAQAAQLQEVEGALEQLLATTDQSLALADAWRELDTWLQEKGTTLILLFDDLDIAMGESDTALSARRSMLIGLLDQANSAWFAGRRLGARVFLRSDLFNSLGTEEQAKYRQRGFELTWRADDLWRLVIRALAVGSPEFHAELERRGIAAERLDDLPREDWIPALELIWGERMGGSGESNTRTTTWAEKRLKDSAERLFPRAALWLLDAALERRRDGRVDQPPLLDATALRAAMPRVSENRFDELLAESNPPQKERLRRLRGFKSYQNRTDFTTALRAAGESDPEEALKDLEALGVVETGARRDKTPTTRIVDLYAFAPQLDIQRLGRR